MFIYTKITIKEHKIYIIEEVKAIKFHKDRFIWQFLGLNLLTFMILLIVGFFLGSYLYGVNQLWVWIILIVISIILLLIDIFMPLNFFKDPMYLLIIKYFCKMIYLIILLSTIFVIALHYNVLHFVWIAALGMFTTLLLNMLLFMIFDYKYFWNQTLKYLIYVTIGLITIYMLGGFFVWIYKKIKSNTNLWMDKFLNFTSIMIHILSILCSSFFLNLYLPDIIDLGEKAWNKDQKIRVYLFGSIFVLEHGLNILQHIFVLLLKTQKKRKESKI